MKMKFTNQNRSCVSARVCMSHGMGRYLNVCVCVCVGKKECSGTYAPPNQLCIY